MGNTERLMDRAGVHDEWRPILGDALASLDPDYLQSLLQDDDWLPGPDHLLAAFRRDRLGMRYLLIGESPYPRPESANGVAFYDAAVGGLWSEQGLSKPVNRATSLRNILKAALLAEGLLQKDADGKIPQQSIAEIDKSHLISTLGEFFDNLQRAGFLMLNATPVLHAKRRPAQEAKYWQAFLARILASISAQAPNTVTLVLWGKIAQVVEASSASAGYRQLVCEHPYNISFIDNPQMQALFAQLRLLQRPDGARA